MKDEMFVKCILYRSFECWIMMGVFSYFVVKMQMITGTLHVWQKNTFLKDDLSYRPRRRLGPLGDVLLWTSVPVCLLGILMAEEFNKVFFLVWVSRSENRKLQHSTSNPLKLPGTFATVPFVLFLVGSDVHLRSWNSLPKTCAGARGIEARWWVWNHLCLLRSPACRWIDKVASLSCKTWVQRMEPSSMDRSLLPESLWQRWWYWHGYATSSIDFISFLSIRSRKAWIRDPWHPRLVKNTLRPQNVDLQCRQFLAKLDHGRTP